MREARRILEQVAEAELPLIVADSLGIPRDEVELEADVVGLDLALRGGAWRFAVELAGTPPATYAAKWERLQAVRLKGSSWVRLLAVPYMTEHGRELCEASGINWLDMSGNASVRGSGLRLHVAGRPNKHARPGRPSSPFATRAVRLTRALLQAPDRTWTISECAAASGLDLSQASRTVRRLVDDALLSREAGVVRVPSPERLLEAWRADADFTKHRRVEGVVAAKSGEALAPQLSRRLAELGIPSAATGLAAAWQLDRFAAFRLTTFYVAKWPSDSQLAELRVQTTAAAPNVWLVVPNDDGVFDGATVVDGVRCVHPVQVYVDLKGHPERAPEAAEHLKRRVLKWGDA